MARTKSDKYDSKRNSIMQNAAHLFATNGFSGASVLDISKACKVSKSLIYHYYDAKEDILYDVMTGHINELLSVISDENLIASDPDQEFYNLTLALLKCYAGAEHAQKVLLYDLNNLPPEQRKDIVMKQRAIIERFEQVYVRIFPETKNNTALLRSKIMLFFGSLNWVHTWFSPKGPISRTTLAKLAVENSLGTNNTQ